MEVKTGRVAAAVRAAIEDCPGADDVVIVEASWHLVQEDCRAFDRLTEADVADYAVMFDFRELRSLAARNRSNLWRTTKHRLWAWQGCTPDTLADARRADEEAEAEARMQEALTPIPGTLGELLHQSAQRFAHAGDRFDHFPAA